ncbi:MAG: hypothetical protein Q7R57_00165 [Dehalococcoidales bacterium]|nr:hypothetical protein [Dehalococcoidales bacterium]
MKISDYFKAKPHKPIDVLVEKILRDSSPRRRKQGSVKRTMIDDLVYKDKRRKRNLRV